jgi:hypothetical protein
MVYSPTGIFKERLVVITPRIHELHEKAIENYSECPKFATIMFHTDQTDPSEFHVVSTNEIWDITTRQPGIFCEKKVFTVPKQPIIAYYDEDYGRFAIVKVIPQNSEREFWLVAAIRLRKGFLIPLSAYNYTHDPVADFQVA